MKAYNYRVINISKACEIGQGVLEENNAEAAIEAIVRSYQLRLEITGSADCTRYNWINAGDDRVAIGVCIRPHEVPGIEIVDRRTKATRYYYSEDVSYEEYLGSERR